MGALASLYSLSLPYSRTHTHTHNMHEHTRAHANWLGTNHLLWRTGAFHSSVVMYGVWLLLATSPCSHKFNTSSYRAKSGSNSALIALNAPSVWVHDTVCLKMFSFHVRINIFTDIYVTQMIVRTSLSEKTKVHPVSPTPILYSAFHISELSLIFL